MNIRIFVVFCALLCFAITVHSQHPHVKSESLQETSPWQSSKEYLDLLYQRSSACLKRNSYDTALRFAKKGLEVGAATGDSIGIVRFGRVAGRAYRRLGHIDSAISLYQVLLPICRKQKLIKEELLMLNAYAIAFTFKAQYDDALRIHFHSLSLESACGDSLSTAITLNNIGLVYFKLKQYDKALAYFRDCYALKQRLNDDFDVPVLLINLGLCHAYLGNFIDAERFVDSGLASCDQDCNQRRIEAAFTKGVIRLGMARADEAERFFRESLTRAVSQNDIRFQLDNIYYLSEINITKKAYDTAAAYLKRGEDLIANHAGFNLEKIKLYSRLIHLYRTVRNFRNASDYQFRYIQLRDSVYSEELTNNLMRIEAGHLERENLSKIASQKAMISLNEAVMVRQDVINSLLLLAIVISTAFVLVLFKDYRQKKYMNTLLDAKIVERTRQLNFANETLKAALHEKDLRLGRTVSLYVECVKRIERVCLTGLKDVSDRTARTYMLRIESLANEVKNNELLTSAND